MHNVFIIGNGFDLSLGLNTSYRDFVTSDQFMQNVGVGNELFDYLKKVNDDSNWIDIEKELVNYSVQTKDDYGFLKEYKKLCDELKSYIKSINLEFIDKSSEAFKLFSDSDLGNDFIIINFNYTDSVAYILKSIGYGDEIEDNIIHVHGSAEIDSIIFGVDDSSNINDEHSFLYKSTSSICSGQDCINVLNNFKKLHVFGHSLGESDHMYFDFLHNLVLGNNKYKEINIYHYGEEAKYPIYKQLHKLTYNGVSKLKNNTLFKDIDVKKYC